MPTLCSDWRWKERGAGGGTDVLSSPFSVVLEVEETSRLFVFCLLWDAVSGGLAQRFDSGVEESGARPT